MIASYILVRVVLDEQILLLSGSNDTSYFVYASASFIIGYNVKPGPWENYRCN